jgi:hypothetical protein
MHYPWHPLLEALWNEALAELRELEDRLEAFDARTVPQQQADEPRSKRPRTICRRSDTSQQRTCG